MCRGILFPGWNLNEHTEKAGRKAYEDLKSSPDYISIEALQFRTECQVWFPIYDTVWLRQVNTILIATRFFSKGHDVLCNIRRAIVLVTGLLPHFKVQPGSALEQRINNVLTIKLDEAHVWGKTTAHKSGLMVRRVLAEVACAYAQATSETGDFNDGDIARRLSKIKFWDNNELEARIKARPRNPMSLARWLRESASACHSLSSRKDTGKDEWLMRRVKIVAAGLDNCVFNKNNAYQRERKQGVGRFKLLNGHRKELKLASSSS